MRSPTTARGSSTCSTGTASSRAARPARGNLSPEDFVEAVQHSCELFFRRSREPLTDAVHRQRADLADLDPRSLRETAGLALERQRKRGSRLLTRLRN